MVTDFGGALKVLTIDGTITTRPLLHTLLITTRWASSFPLAAAIAGVVIIQTITSAIHHLTAF
jgi:hypothetical protein